MNRLVSGMALLIGAAFFSCKEKPPVPNPPTPVNLFTVTRQDVLYYDRFPSTTQALSQVDLRPEVQGYITGIFFTEGTHVRKGQKLYEIDKRLYQANYDQAADNVRVAEGNEKQAQQDADRYTYLNSYNAIAKQVLDHALIALQNAKNETRAAEQTLKTAATNLTYATIYAPFDGVIGFSQVKLGNMVTVGSTILNTISTVDPMAVDFLINEAQLGHYEDLKMNKQKTIDSLFTIVLPNHSIYPKMGRISVIDRAVDAQTGTIRVRLVFPNPGDALVAGMSCIVRVHNQEATPQLFIPGKAVVEQMGEYFVFVAKDTIYHSAAADPAAATGKGGASSSGDQKGPEDKGEGDKKGDSERKGADTVETPKLRAIQKKLVLGQTIGANVVVQSGINEGDRIVVDGIQALHDGSLITLSNRPGPAQGGKRQ